MIVGIWKGKKAQVLFNNPSKARVIATILGADSAGLLLTWDHADPAIGTQTYFYTWDSVISIQPLFRVPGNEAGDPSPSGEPRGS